MVADHMSSPSDSIFNDSYKAMARDVKINVSLCNPLVTVLSAEQMIYKPESGYTPTMPIATHLA